MPLGLNDIEKWEKTFSAGIDVDVWEKTFSGDPGEVSFQLAPEPEERGIAEEIGTALVSGAVGGTEQYARAARTLGIPSGDVIKKISKFGEKYEPSRDGKVWEAITGGISSTVQSLMAGVPTAVAGTVIGGPTGTILGFAAGGGTLFSLAEYDKFMEEAEQHGLSREEVKPQALVSAIVEGGFEGLSNLIGGKIFGFFGRTPAAQAAKKTILQAFKKFLINVLKFQGAEQPTEMATAYIQTMERNAAGIPAGDPWENAKAVIGPVAVQTLLMGGVGAAVGPKELPPVKPPSEPAPVLPPVEEPIVEPFQPVEPKEVPKTRGPEPFKPEKIEEPIIEKEVTEDELQKKEREEEREITKAEEPKPTPETMAKEFNLPVCYDMQYLAVAELEDCELWTSDERLVNSLSSQNKRIKWVGDYSKKQAR